MTNQNGNSRSTFSGKMGYVLAVAGSAVGLGLCDLRPHRGDCRHQVDRERSEAVFEIPL